MWVQKRGDKYRYFQKYVDKAGRKRTICLTLPDDKKSSRKIAEKRLAEMIAERQPLKGRSITFGEMLVQYKAYLSKEMKPQTARIAEYQFRGIEKLIGSDTMMNALSAPLVRERLSDANPATYNERLKHFKAALRWAYREEIIENVDFLARLPKKRVESRREALAGKYLEADELKKLLDGMSVKKWRLLSAFLVLSGLRIGEAIALTQKDVDLKNREITVNKTYSLPLKAVSPNAKTDSGNRVVSIQDELLQTISEINAIMPRRRTIFFDDGGYILYEAYAKYLRENTERIIGRRLSPHALRHTHVALLAAAGLSYDAIARRVGHAHSDITRDVYMHVTQRLREHDAEAVRGIKLL